MANHQIGLTNRERQILALLFDGCANKEIAARLGVSDQTIKNQLTTLYQKAGVGSRLELVVVVTRKGWLRKDRGKSSRRMP